MLTPADIAARVPADTYRQAFDRNSTGDEGEIAAFAALCCDEAVSEFRMCVGATVRAVLETGLVTEEHVRGQLSRVALFKAVENTPLGTADPKSPYVAAYTRVRADWERLRTDNGQRLTDGGERARPHARVVNARTETDRPTNPYAQQRDGKGSGY